MNTFAVSGPSVSRCAFAAFRVLAVLSLGACALWGQITTGALSGTVSDPAGVVVVGARVQVVNQGTGVTTSLVTNDAGLYKAAFLTPVIYTVRVQAPGFQTFEAEDVVV